MTDDASPPPQKLSEEEGFITFDIFQPHYSHNLPLRTAGLLAFLFVEEDSDSEVVLKLLLADDLAKCFLESRPFCGRANKAAYLVFPRTDSCNDRVGPLAERYKRLAQLTEKYNPPQESWPVNRYSIP